jgi:hypothetical protein
MALPAKIPIQVLSFEGLLTNPTRVDLIWFIAFKKAPLATADVDDVFLRCSTVARL